MADTDPRRERAQVQTFERVEDAALYQRYIKMKQDRDDDKSKEQANRISLEEAVDIVGTCDMMCPEFESLQRYFERDLDPFEKSPTGAYDRSLMVQTFARAAAGNDLPPPEDIRPPRVLRVTIEYLLDNILVQHGIEATHNFIWNRTRAVRSDLTRQRDHSPEAIYCLERIVRYHILALHVVCRGQREVETLEIEQLKKALQSLMEVYQDARSQYSSPHEPEFRSYYILMHIRSKHAPFTLRHLPTSVYNSPTLQWALRLRFTIARNTDGADEHNSDVTQMDYAGFFDLLSQPHTSYLTACLLESHFDDIRRQLCLMLGLTLKNTARLVPIQYFQGYLRLDNVEDTVGWALHLKWNINPQGMVEIPQSRKPDNLLPPIATATAFPRPKSMLVQMKRRVTGQFSLLQNGALDSLITRSEGSTFGRDYMQPLLVPQRRRIREPVLPPAALPIATPQPHFQAISTPASGFSLSRPAVTPAPQAQAQSLFNPFGRPPQRPISVNLNSAPIPPITSTVAPTSAFSIAPTQPAQSTPALQQTRAKQPTSASISTPPPPHQFFAQPRPVSIVTQPSPFLAGIPPPITVSLIPPVVPVSITSTAAASNSQNAPTVPSPTSLPTAPVPTTALGFSGTPSPLTNREQLQESVSFEHPKEQAISSIRPPQLAHPAPLPSQLTSFGPTNLSSDATSVTSTVPARREGPRRQFSDGYASAASSVMPASTQADRRDVPKRTLKLPESDEESSTESSDSDDHPHQMLHSQAQEHNRLSTLKNVVQQWRD
ncbi:hypothetical protein FRC17_006474, partial [Serendipita sp. 399]